MSGLVLVGPRQSITERIGLEKNFKEHLVQLPCNEQECLQHQAIMDYFTTAKSSPFRK